ncbi:MAG TPA: hypothetical protein V6D12_08410, partial [Candidatus Obscuribacterales bacterium]
GLVFIIRKEWRVRLLCKSSGIQKLQIFSESDRRGILLQFLFKQFQFAEEDVGIYTFPTPDFLFRRNWE